MADTSSTDVLVLGGGFAGASTALLLLRGRPGLRVTIVERSEKFDRKVGEATTEVSGAFLTKRLGITAHLTNHHIVKNGLRFWFCESDSDTFESAGELGPKFHVRMPGYQVDREVLDEFLLGLAASEGAEILRPARLDDVEIGAAGQGVRAVVHEAGGTTREIHARWLIDASGRAATLARKFSLLRKVPAHPTNSIWARMRGVKDFDSLELRDKFPGFAAAVQASRTSATNHLTGFGWWCWIIPLKGGDTSVGLVYDERLFSPPAGGNLAARLLSHVRSNPLGRELFERAEVIEGDVRAYSALPYYSECLAGDGWQLAGDAAGFMDPLYSAGLDYASWTASMAAGRVLAEARGENPRIEEINRNWRLSYTGWMEALYVDKYFYLGDRALMTAAYLMDLGLFFFGPVREIVRDVPTGFAVPPFCGKIDRKVARIMRFYNLRLAELGRQKMEAGIYGKGNSAGRFLVSGFSPTPGVWLRILDGAALWLLEEIRMLLVRARSRDNRNPSP